MTYKQAKCLSTRANGTRVVGPAQDSAVEGQLDEVGDLHGADVTSSHGDRETSAVTDGQDTVFHSAEKEIAQEDATVNGGSSEGVDGQRQTEVAFIMGPHAESQIADPEHERIPLADDDIGSSMSIHPVSNADTCAICLEAMEDEEKVRVLTCGHSFHADCLDPWLTTRRAYCPLCKFDFYVPKPEEDGAVDSEMRDSTAQGPNSAHAHPVLEAPEPALVIHDDAEHSRRSRLMTAVARLTYSNRTREEPASIPVQTSNIVVPQPVA
jgi:hypothetical protein